MNSQSNQLAILSRMHDPRDVLDAALDVFDRPVLATSLGPQSIVILDLLHALGRVDAVDVVWLDTGLMPPETEALHDALQQRFGIVIARQRPAHTVLEQEAREGPALWTRDPDRCCALRKVAPMQGVLRDRAAWITGLRRDQSPARAHTETVGWDRRNGLVRIAPLAWWTRDRMWQHLLSRALPYNPLLDQGYASVGCAPCTSPVGAGEDERAGRWRGRARTECGLHG